jgi:hypothetical protein
VGFFCEISPFEKGHGLAENVQSSFAIPKLLNDTEGVENVSLRWRAFSEVHWRLEVAYMRMLRRGQCIFLIAILCFVLNGTAFAAFRCGTHLIHEGDTKAEVIHKCGEPSHVDAWMEERIARDFYYPAFSKCPWPRNAYRIPAFVKEHVRVEVWTYNFGPTQFIRLLRFENGMLKDISRGGYGY